MKLNAEVVKKVSSKTGKEYVVIEIELVTGYKKVVFLEEAELALIKLSQANHR